MISKRTATYNCYYYLAGRKILCSILFLHVSKMLRVVLPLLLLFIAPFSQLELKTSDKHVVLAVLLLL